MTLLSKMVCTSSALTPALVALSLKAAVEWISDEASFGTAAMAGRKFVPKWRRSSHKNALNQHDIQAYSLLEMKNFVCMGF